MFDAILVEKNGGGSTASLARLDDNRLPESDVTVRVSHSTLNYKDGLAITGKLLPHLEIEIVKRSDHAKGFEFLPRRWVAPSRGSIAVAAWPRISKISPETHSLFSASPRFVSCSESFV